MRRIATLTFGLCASLLLLASCNNEEIFEPTPIEETVFAPTLNVNLDEMTKHPAGFYYQDLVEGDGEMAVDSAKITVKYWGYLADGTLVDTTDDLPNKTAVVQIGVGKLIKGWDLGIPGMREGGKRKLVIPYNLAYGSMGFGSKVPPYATLVFDVELLEVELPEPDEEEQN